MKLVVMLLCLLCCPVWAADAGAPDMNEDSGLTWYQIAGLLAAIGTATTLGWQGHKKMNAIRIEPQPLEVKRISECATRKELEDFKADVRADFRRVHNRIDNNDSATAEIKGQLAVIAKNQEKILNLLLQRQ